jgi:hypothetical protein
MTSGECASDFFGSGLGSAINFFCLGRHDRPPKKPYYHK